MLKAEAKKPEKRRKWNAPSNRAFQNIQNSLVFWVAFLACTTMYYEPYTAHQNFQKNSHILQKFGSIFRQCVRQNIFDFLPFCTKFHGFSQKFWKFGPK